MAIKELTTRIALKYDTYQNWTKEDVADQGANLVLLRGEIGICEVPSVNADTNFAPTVLFKVGDGEKTFKQLPWASAKAADVYGWAKKSEEDFKTWLDTEAKFATDAEVEAIRSGLDARITAIEGSVGTGKVAEDIAAIKGRLDVIEGEGEGSIAAGDAATLASAKTYAEGQAADVKSYVDGDFKTAVQNYADGKASAAQSGAEATADAALTAYKNEMTTALAGKQDVIEANTYDAYGAAANVKTYVDETVVPAANTYADGKASAAETAAKAYTDGEVDKLEAEDLRLAGLIGGNTTAIGNEVTARENAVNAINTKIGTVTEGKDVVTMISDAQAAAVTSANGYTDGKVSDLENGQVKTNKEAISTLSGTVSSEIARVEGLVSTEATNRENADNAIIERLESVEAFFETAEGETLDGALDTLKEIQDYLNGEGEATGGMIGRVAALETGVENLEGRMDTAEDDIDALEGRATAVEGRATTLEGKVEALEKKPFDTYATKTEVEAAQKAADDAQDAADTAQGEVDALEGVVSTLRTEYDVTKALATTNEAAISALDGRVGTAEGKISALETASAKHAEKTYVDDELAKKVNVSDYNTAIGNVYTKDEADGKFGLKTAVEKNATDIGTNASNIADLTGRVTTVEGNITTLQGIVSTGDDSNANLRSAITSLQTLTGADGAIRQEIAAAKKAGDDAAAAVTALTNGQVATNKTNIEGLDSRLTAVENDYVKASDLVGDYYIFNCGSSTTVTHVVPKN